MCLDSSQNQGPAPCNQQLHCAWPNCARVEGRSNCCCLEWGRWQEQIMEVLRACAEEKSWRVRYMLADNVKALCEVFKERFCINQ